MPLNLYGVLNHHDELMLVAATDKDQVIKVMKEETFVWRSIVLVGVANPKLKAGVYAADSDLFQPN